MRSLDRHHLLAALSLLVMALLVAGRYPTASRWRPVLRWAAITGFGIAVALALADIALWTAAWWGGGAG